MKKQDQANKRLFNKLFAEMSSVRRVKKPIETVNNIKLTKSIRYLYFSKKSHMWFGSSETKNTYIYFFGFHTKHINQLNSVDNSIMIDFDKNTTFNETSLGIITDNLTVYLNKEILESKYPTFNTTGLKEHIIKQFDNGIKLELNTFELGQIDEDFIDNLKIIIGNTLIETATNPTNNNDTNETKTMNLFLNSIKAGKSYEDALRIANIQNETVKSWYLKGKKGNKNYKDFYNNFKEIMPRDEDETLKMNMIIDSMKTGKTGNESINTANVTSSQLKEWIKKGESGEVEYIDFYEDYRILERKNKPKSKTKNQNKELINKYINLINEGKTNKEAFKILNIPKFKVKNWKKQGQLGNKDYKEFYDTYLMAVNREEFNKINQFIDLINDGKSNEEAIKTIKMPKFKIKQWFNKGKNGEEDYIDFYNAYMKQYEKNKKDTIPTENPKPAINEIKNKSGKTCEICGRTINKKSKETICKRCRRKQRCANIVQELLPSIDPGIPFKKDDLKKLGLTGMQVQDYIWTLQEFSLINKEKNNKFSLISKEKLEEFIKESGVELKEQETPAVKLTKKCNTCGKTLEISKFPVSENTEDGYEEDCKTCKKLITTASYLKELIEYVEYNKEFSEDDIKKFYPDPFLLQAKIWSLLDNDLLIKNIETNKYTLVEKEKCEEFLDKYFKNTPIKKSETTPTTPKPIIKPKKTTKLTSKPKTKPIRSKKQAQMDCILSSIKNGSSRKEAAKQCGISLFRITHWYKEGRDGFSEDNIYFYKTLMKIEKTQSDKLKNNMKIVLKVLKSGGSKSKAAKDASIEESEIDQWIKKGEKGLKPYSTFKRKYDKIYKKSIDYDDKHNVRLRKIFIENIKDGKTRKEAAKKASIELKLIDSWIIRGTKGEKPYDEFYNEYVEARKIAKDKPNSIEDRIKNEFIDLLKEGYSHGEASRKIENGEYAKKIKKWYAAGKHGVKTHLKFYLDCKEAGNIYKTNKNKIFTILSDGFTIKESCEKLNLNPVIIKKEILKGIDGEKPYNEFYFKIIESKTSLIDINQMFKSPNHPHKTQMVDVLELMLIGTSEKEALIKVNVDEDTFRYWLNRGKREFGQLYVEFYQIYNEIKSGELQKQSQKDIIKEIEKELEEIEDKDANILNPMPKKMKMQLDNLYGKTHTGFAWVNKVGNLWTYSRKIKGRNIKITDINIYELHRKVIKNNLMWGVRNLEKAKETLKMEGNEPIKKTKTIKKDEDNPIGTSNKTLNEDILSPLPPHIKTKFSKGSKTGFAWVNKIGNYFYYIRSNKNIRIKASNIEELYEQVLKNNLDWGVIDLTNAKRTLNQNKSSPTKIEKKNFNQKEDILVPLPEEIENELKKYSRGTSTGFAWVSKIGTKYSYTRVIDGEELNIKESNIYRLHEKVIGRNLIWGVRNLEKAKQTLNEKQDVVSDNQPKKIPEVINQDILAPLPKQFEDSFKSTKTNKTGIAWVNKIGKNWIYSRRINEKTVEIKDSNIYKLHEKVIKQKLTWGIRDYDKAKITLAIKSLKIGNILEPVNEDELNTYQNNNFGFALVEKNGNQWEYMRLYNGIKIKDDDIYGLFEKVIDKNLFWGVTDFKKAIETLTNENNLQELENNESKEINETNLTLNINPINSESGIAWVTKKDNYWVYSRLINDNPIEIKDYNIYRLHKKVINKNLTWGIIDSENAKKTLTSKPLDGTTKYILSPISKKLSNYVKTDTGFALVFKKEKNWEYQISNTKTKLTHENIFGLYEQAYEKNLLWGVTDTKKAKNSLKINELRKESSKKNIFSQLSQEDLNSLNKQTSLKIPKDHLETNKNRTIFSPLPKGYEKINGKTGFAWVNKVGKKWRYLRNINEENIIIDDENIINLYNKVIENNLLWAVTDINKAKKLINEETNNILVKLPEKIKFEIDLNNETGFAWLSANEKEWEYSKIKNGMNISIKHEDIYKLYEIICQNKYDWGVIDLNKALNTLSKTPEEIYATKNTKDNTNQNKNNSIENDNMNRDILAPLPENVEKELRKVSYGTNTGFAWVIKTGREYSYQKMVDNELLIIADSDIKELHKKVIEQNYLWGVRDLIKAKETLQKCEKNQSKTNHSNESILKPLPLNIKQKLRKNSKGNISGFAWVSKIGNKWHYTRVINGKTIHFKDEDIYKLHETVIKGNQLWGVRDLTKAKQTLKGCNKKLPEPPKIDKIPDKTVQKSFEGNETRNDDILAPLPEKYQRSMKFGPSYQTGIEWVSKIGNLWVYSKNTENGYISIKDSDIFKLHKKVLKEGHIWGIRDYNKARQILYNAQPNDMDSKSKTKTSKEKQPTVFVTLNENIISIEGKIKNNEVLKVLTKIYEFGDNIMKLNTEKQETETLLSIELELSENQINEFKSEIKEFGWEIIT